MGYGDYRWRLLLAGTINVRAVLRMVGRAKTVLTKVSASVGLRCSSEFLNPGKTVVFRLSAVGQRGSWIGSARFNAFALPESERRKLGNSKGILTNANQNEQHLFAFQ